MASQNGQDNVPDSWDDNPNGSSDPTSDLSSGLSSLNVNAPVFTPGQNVFAQPFVPTFDHTTPQHTTSSTDGEVQSQGFTPQPNPEETPPQELEKEAMETDGIDVSPVEEGNGDIANWDEGEDEEEDIEDEEEDEDDPEAVMPVKKPKVPGQPKVRKEHLNVVFIGHVDAGKSTIGGHLLYLTGMVDKRTLEKYEREAKEKNRETWYLSWALDTNLEEREKGKTVEVGRAFFESEKKHYSVLDAPGHKSFVPNMICGASQADLAILVISARRGEFETGFERGGQTREHAMLVKTAGVKHLVVLINKMDDPTVEWEEARYNECKEKLLPYLKKCGFNPKTDVYFMPCSGLTGAFLTMVPDDSVCPWFTGPSLLEYLDVMPPISRASDAAVRLPVVDRYKDMGTIVLGKIESGIVTTNQKLLMMPNKAYIKVMTIVSDEEDSEDAMPGENVKLKISGVEEEDVSPGFVLCSPEDVCNTGRIFDAQIVILEYKSIISAGYSCVLHIHSCVEEVTIKALICLIDKKTGEKSQVRPRFIKPDQAGIARLEVNGGLICLETFKDFPQMGRFTLRDEGKTIAIGKVLKIKE
ncbi:eukaryotic peptide chain release factor GTP-binding subunit ERF3A isoform X1 [Aplysia californica]|uniref:Eukaryotic peptide chain release factor GTP-binding subunit ERF3A isoform X1 n=1 Tax=Aplysia californica TaxID=6500 RepID=A0ABM0JP01_APLCA|nr:eukaryotic peptide chain release factor GTP-binding subunit ERF3A isoform X1 [Aplysia californica]